jgi:uncharacterized protein DUF5522
MLRSNRNPIVNSPESLVEGEDFYWEGEAMVFTARYHLRRGYCCDSGCRNCPFEKHEPGSTKLEADEERQG